MTSQYGSEFPQHQYSNDASCILLASLPVKLQAIIKIVFTGKFLLTQRTDTDTS
ncbi:hypothetical protein L873DRAFT_91170 [Choiromyces venosus 120613-1]|uniref:Uncharacterized protein n=1 Tax=Choiromyces venosus 120613-1 TaxID=1336337 RepID=A0A3N4K2E4_9PEZI|nr:hypothetical protein L873DRAFT_91170 [Choiromyces venosus 120613-1]